MDNEIIKAKQATTQDDFITALAYVFSVLGIKPPDDTTVMILQNNWLRSFATRLNFSEFKLAFELNEVGTKWDRIDHFQQFSLRFMSEVLTKYIGERGKTLIKHKPQDVTKQLTGVTPDQILKERHIEIFHEIKDGKTPILTGHDTLYNLLLPHFEKPLSDFETKANGEAKIRYKALSKGSVKRSEYDPSFHNADLKSQLESAGFIESSAKSAQMTDFIKAVDEKKYLEIINK